MNLISIIALILTCFSIASAHVTVEATNLIAGEYSKLTLRVPHGCDGSSTTKISVKIPEGILSVKPQIHTGWSIQTKEVKLKKAATLHGKPVTEVISEVTWSGGPLPDKYMDEFGISVRMPDTASKIYFPVLQECEKGSSNWNEINENGKFPAPSIQLNEKPKSEGQHHH